MNDPDVTVPEGVPGITRRDAIKRGAIVGGAVVWATPVIQTIGMRPAGAQTPSPVPCACSSDAYALRVIIPVLNLDETIGEDGCATTADLALVAGQAGIATVNATVACAESASGATCTASASVATLDVVVGSVLNPTLTVSATVLTSNASASCDPCATSGDSNIATLTVNGIVVNVDSLTCNNDVLGLGLVTFNEQSCDPATGTLGVNALHINVAGIAEVIVAHSEAGAPGCPCPICA